MDPITIASLAGTLIKSGPEILRTVGAWFGGGAQETTNKIAGTIEQVDEQLSDVASADYRRDALHQNVTDMLKTLSKEELFQLQQVEARLAEIDAEREARQLQHDETIFESGQQTIREGDKSANDKVANCRPNLAYISATSTAVYVVGMSLANAFGHGTGPDLAVAASLATLAVVIWDCATVRKARERRHKELPCQML